MKMFVCELAELRVGFQNRYRYLPFFCRGYETDGEPELILAVNDRELEQEAEAAKAAGIEIAPPIENTREKTPPAAEALEKEQAGGKVLAKEQAGGKVLAQTHPAAEALEKEQAGGKVLEKQCVFREKADRDASKLAEGWRGYYESVALYRKFCLSLSDYDGFLLHAGVMAADGVGVAISAKSGVGKTTHLRLWQQAFGERVRILNGDKPPVRRRADGFYAYGTPWCGKEGYGERGALRLSHLVFLERGAENRVRRITPSEAFPLLFGAVMLPQEEERMQALLPLLDAFLSSVSLWVASCNKEPAAALAVYHALMEDTAL